MRNRLLYIAAIACFVLAGASNIAQSPAKEGAPAPGPDPREIAVPPIATPLGTLPGVNELPARTAMPDVMVMNDGTRVTTRRQWEARCTDSCPSYAGAGTPRLSQLVGKA